MSKPTRPIAYVLGSSNHGPMILNINDYARHESGGYFGVGAQLLSTSAYDADEVELALRLLELRRQGFGPGVVALDGGANIGVHTIEWARHMHGWGRVLAFEAQEYVFYALAGNIAINNCFNASARWCALGEHVGHIDIPEPDYQRAGSFGSLELRRRDSTESIGQPVSYEAEDLTRTPMVSIDSLQLQRLDFLKLDVEGMEDEVLRGARETLARCKPILLTEVIKSDPTGLAAFLESAGYHLITDNMGNNAMAVHKSDPSLQEILKP